MPAPRLKHALLAKRVDRDPLGVHSVIDIVSGTDVLFEGLPAELRLSIAMWFEAQPSSTLDVGVAIHAPSGDPMAAMRIGVKVASSGHGECAIDFGIEVSEIGAHRISLDFGDVHVWDQTAIVGFTSSCTSTVQ